MKKALVLFAAVAFLAAATTSCNKHCTCKTYLNGVVTSTTEDVELDKDSYKKCSEMNTLTTVADKKNGLECK